MARTKNNSLIEYERKKKEETRKKILAAIETLKNDFAKITISSISKVSGVSREALYSHKDLIDSHSIKSAKDLTIKEIDALIKENQKLKKIIAKLTKENNENIKII